jgi:hypothetical protein
MAADEVTFDAVFAKLRAILKQYEGAMVVERDSEGEYYLNTRRFDKRKKPIFFGAVKINKNYVSFHFMPVYMYPQLLDTAPEGLRKRMQGKSCFNFTRVDDEAFEQLARLTARGVERVREAGFS